MPIGGDSWPGFKLISNPEATARRIAATGRDGIFDPGLKIRTLYRSKIPGLGRVADDEREHRHSYKERSCEPVHFVTTLSLH